MEDVIIAAVEAGGTSFVVAVAKVAAAEEGKSNAPPIILAQLEVDSSHDRPMETLEACAAFLKRRQPDGGYHALGLASFGPVGLNPSNQDSYGRIGSTSPKASWRNVDLLTPLVTACQGSLRSLAVKIETDVNAPAMAEYRQVQDQLSSLAYVTVGTGKCWNWAFPRTLQTSLSDRLLCVLISYQQG